MSWAKIEKYFSWLAIPHIGVLIVTLQAAGFFFTLLDPVWSLRLALVPQAVLDGGEYWRLITFLALPLSQGLIWVLFSLWFLYFIFQTLESEWGAFRTTLYVLISWALTVAYSLMTGFPVFEIRHFETSVFIATALLFPEFEVSLFFLMPIQLKWLALFSGAWVVIELFTKTWIERGLILCLYSNLIVFFGPAILSRWKSQIRRWRFKSKM